MKQVGNTILAKGGNHILAKRDNSAWPKGSKLSGFSKWRDTGLIPFIQIKGKIIYRQSDIDKLLQKHYFESWKE